MNDYKTCIEHLNNAAAASKKHSVPWVKAALAALGNPAAGIPAVHVAGTDGKGSITCYLSSCMRKNKLHVGCFTSPHLISVRERMTCDGENISRQEFAQCFSFVEDTLARAGFPAPSYFEFLFFTAMVWYERKKPDILLTETGMGGRYDATEAISGKILSVITKIGYDHMQYLGNTIPEIAWHKAGIIEEGVPCVCLDAPAEAFRVIEKEAKEKHAPLFFLDSSDFSGNLCVLPSGHLGIDFYFRCHYDKADWKLKLKTPALYQAQNAALSILCLYVLKKTYGWDISAEAVKEGMETAFWEGRMEELRTSSGNTLFVDGAHNVDAMKMFLASVREIRRFYPESRFTLLFSAARDKAFAEELSMIEKSGLFSGLIAFPLAGKRSLTQEELEEALSCAAGGGMEIRICASCREGLALACRKPDVLFAAGSLYLAGEIRSLITGIDND